MLKKCLYYVGVIALTCSAWSCAGKAVADNSNSAFEYREIYLPEHGTDEYENLGLHNLDKEWGVWGHNLGQLFPEKVSQTVYSRSGGVIHKEQYCFSSNELYEYVENYIQQNYGSGSKARFAILPNDNHIVCLCSKCVAAGNTEKDASPAVLKFIKRLAQRFPNHIFFTSYYASTKSIPADSLPDNAGVLISAIDFPLASVETKSERDFENLLREWAKKTDRIYVWDYVNNFDDYFTPYPVFGPMQRRFKLYKNIGVQGLFLNGSGSDYSSLSRLKTVVLAALMENPDIDWRGLLREKSKELYPTAGDVISEFMIAQEDFVEQNGKELPLYQGVTVALGTYLPADKFVSFHNALAEKKEQASGKEKEELLTLYNALELTRLEMMRNSGDISDYEPHLANLLSLESDNGIHVYSETCWTLDSYARDYRRIAEEAAKSKGNKLKGVRLQALNALDPDYNDITVLTDGLIGMPSNYHNGILINSPDEKWSIGIPPVGARTIRVWLVTNPAFKVGLPKRINLLSGGNILGSVEPQLSGDKVGHTFVDFNIPPGVGTLTLILAKDKEVRSMSVEEIEAF